jgi:hypothetical protein
MKLAARLLSVLAALALATPALACTDKHEKTTTASASKGAPEGAVAKTTPAKKAGKAKAGDAKPATN